jgi:nucleoside-diphosphate-sugar epimerase
MRAVNVEATRALLTAARGSVRHWVQVSSLSVYGNPRAGVVTEETRPAPVSLYARTKHEADALVEAHAQEAFGHVIVRPAAIIGRTMRNASMRALIDAVARRRFAFIGPPGAIGNYVHEDNITDALLACGTCAEAGGRIYNVSQNCTIEHIVGTIASALGVPPPRARIPEPLARLAAAAGRAVPGFPLTRGRVDALTSRVEYPADRIERELGLRARKPLEDALRDLVVERKDAAR